MPQVHIPPALRRFTADRRVIEAEGTSVGEVVAFLDREHPGFRDRIIVDGRLKPGIAIARGSRISDLGLLEPVEPCDEIHFVLSVSGG